LLNQFTRTDSQNAQQKTPTDLSRFVQGYRPFARTESKSDKSISIVANSVCYLENFLLQECLSTDATSGRPIDIRAFILHLQQIELTGRFSRQCLLCTQVNLGLSALLQNVDRPWNLGYQTMYICAGTTWFLQIIFSVWSIRCGELKTTTGPLIIPWGEPNSSHPRTTLHVGFFF
jgi:hypothetical protein